MVQRSLLSIKAKKNKKKSLRKKVTFNRHVLVEVIYECYIPAHIRRSSLLLQKFSTKIDDDSKQYLRGLMRRKNLERVSSPSNQHECSNHFTKNFFRMLLMRKVEQNQYHPRPRRLNPFRKELQETNGKQGNEEITNVKKNVRKTQVTMDHFFGCQGM